MPVAKRSVSTQHVVNPFWNFILEMFLSLVVDFNELLNGNDRASIHKCSFSLIYVKQF